VVPRPERAAVVDAAVDAKRECPGLALQTGSAFVHAQRKICRVGSLTAQGYGFLLAMDISCWSFMRTAKLAEPLMKDGGTTLHHDILRLPGGG
jgi:hypothetical protein